MPTRRTLLALVIAAALFAFAGVSPAVADLSLVLNVAVLTLLVLDRRNLPAPGDVAVTRDCQNVFFLARPNRVDITVTNGGPHHLRGVLQDNTPASCPRDPGQLAVDLPPDSRLDLSYHVAPSERGRFRFSDAILRARGPLGLAFRDYRFPSPGSRYGTDRRKAEADFTVYPVLGAAVPPRGGALLHMAETGYHKLHRQVEGTSPSQIRPWAPGDSYRDINWKATARYDRPMVMQYDTDRNQTVCIFVDCGRLMGTPCPRPAGAASEVPLRRLDYAVNACAELARVAIEHGDIVGICCFSDRVRVWLDPRGKRQHLLRVLEVLATIQADTCATDYDAPINMFLSQTKRRSLCLFLTAFSESAGSTQLMQRLGALRARHIPAVISLSDPDVVRTLSREPATLQEACQKLAAADLREEMELFARTVRQGEGHFLEVPADALSAGAVQTYLDVKSRGRL